MIRIRLPNRAVKLRAVAFLLGRISFRSFRDGVMLVPEAALACLAHEGIPYSVEGTATYADFVPPLRDPAPAAV